MYDNRSAVFASDFPTATFLRGNGILRARLVRDTTYAIGDDLRYALRHWIEGGITINSFSAQGTPLDVDWPKGGLLGELIERFRLMLTLRRNRHGGYGRLVRDSGGG